MTQVSEQRDAAAADKNSTDSRLELPACPIETTLLFLANKWGVLIIRDLLNGPLRFKELQRSIGSISQKVLTANLRMMEAHGLLTRTVYAQVPPRVEYELTDLGYSLRPVLDQLAAWGEHFQRTHAAFPRP